MIVCFKQEISYPKHLDCLIGLVCRNQKSTIKCLGRIAQLSLFYQNSEIKINDSKLKFLFYGVINLHVFTIYSLLITVSWAYSSEILLIFIGTKAWYVYSWFKGKSYRSRIYSNMTAWKELTTIYCCSIGEGSFKVLWIFS